MGSATAITKPVPGDHGRSERIEEVASGIPRSQDAFGDEQFAEVRYKTLTWWQCGLLMIASNISLGVFSLPAAVASLGLIPAMILLIGLGLLATYTGYVMGQFKWRFPHISSYCDAGEILFGSVGREVLFVGQLLNLVFGMASHLLTFTVALNAISGHATCSLVFGVVGMVVSAVISLPRTLSRIAGLSFVSFVSIIAAVILTMIAVGVQNSTRTPVNGIVDVGLVPAFLSVSNIVFSYGNHLTYFNIMVELKDPKDFPKALILMQSIAITLYVVAAVVIYCYVGQDVASPALGSTGPVVSKVAYGISIPTILIAGVIYGHIAFKSIYIRIFAGTDRMHKRDIVAVGSWVGIGVGLWILAWIIASAIPVFSYMLSLMASLFASWFSFGLPGIFWLYMNRGRWFASSRKITLSALNVGCICVGCILCGLGLYSSAKAIHDDPRSARFSCANNA